jgi:hypothetical protein
MEVDKGFNLRINICLCSELIMSQGFYYIGVDAILDNISFWYCELVGAELQVLHSLTGSGLLCCFTLKFQ